MSAEINNAVERYPLCSLSPALKAFRPPAGPFEPGKAWRQVYGVYTLAGQRQAAARRVGTLRLQRSVEDGGRARLRLACDKRLVGGVQKVAAEMVGRADDPLAAPQQWSFETRLLDAAGKAVAGTHLARSAVVRDGVVTIRDARQTQRIRLAGPYTVNWSLFDAVQRLPDRGARKHRFLLIDHFDQPKGDCVLSLRGRMDVAIAGGRTLQTVAFDQVGRGNVPWVYWRDERGRLLFIVAGLEAYLLESSTQA